MEDKHSNHPGYQLVKSAHAWLTTNHPALTPFLMGKEMRPVLNIEDCPPGHPVKTACTDGNRIWVNLEYAQGLGLQQTCGLLMEEIYHIALAHPARRGRRHRVMFNKACDMAIASILIDDGIDVRGKMCYAPEFHGMGAEEIYDELKKLAKDNPEKLAIYIPGFTPPPDMEEADGDDDANVTIYTDQGEGEGGEGENTDSESDQRDDGQGKSRADGSSEDDDPDTEEEDAEGGGAGTGGEDDDHEDADDGAGGSDGGDAEAEGEDEGEGTDAGAEGRGGQPVDQGESVPGDWSGVEPGRGEVLDYEGEEGTKPTPAELDEYKDQMAYEVELIDTVAGQGKGRGGVTRIAKAVRKARVSPTSWKDVLRNFLLDRTSVPRDDWSRPNRRYLGTGAYLPRRDSDVAGDIVVGLDMSGSINYRQLDRMVQCLQEFLDEFGGITLHVIPFDTQVMETEVFEDGDLIKIAASAGGGTSFSPIFKKLEDDKTLAPLAVIMFTDMGASVPREMIEKSGLDVLWVDFARCRGVTRGECYDYIPSGTYGTWGQEVHDAGWYVNMTEIEDY